MNKNTYFKSEELKKIENQLPTSPDDLMKLLDNFKLKFSCFNHEPLKTVEESKLVQKKICQY